MCEIIVYLLVTVQNNRKIRKQVLKFNLSKTRNKVLGKTGLLRTERPARRQCCKPDLYL